MTENKIRKKKLKNSTHLLKCSRLALKRHRLWGVGWGTYSCPKVHPYMAFCWSTCIFSDLPESRSHWLFLCLPRYHWPKVHCKTIRDCFALVPRSSHTFRSWFCLLFYEAFCFYPETVRWNHIENNDTVSWHYQARENEVRFRTFTHVPSLMKFTKSMFRFALGHLVTKRRWRENRYSPI